MPYCGVWKHEPKPDKPDELTKVPYSPTTGRKAKPNDPRTFGTRLQSEHALASAAGCSGLCFLIDESLGITAGDLDHIIPKERAFDESAIPSLVWRLIRVANTYVSWSPSGTGLRFYFAAVVGGYMTRTSKEASIHAEQYSRLHFMTETFRQISNTPDTFNADPGDLQAWIDMLGFPKREEKKPEPEPVFVGDRPDLERIKEVGFGLRNGEKLRRLHEDGDISDYGQDESRADAGLAALWCPFTPDDGMIEDLMRDSALERSKWDRRGDNYLARTIKFARSRQSWWWDWNRQEQRRTVDGIDQDTGEILEPPEPPTDVDCGEIVAHLQKANTKLQQKVAQLRSDNRILLNFVLNANIKSADKLATAAIIDLTAKKTADKDGYVALKAGEISNDWRQKPEPGKNIAALNPDGSKPRMSRGSVSGVMRKLTGLDDEENPSPKFIDAKPDIREVKAKGRDPWSETVWLVKKPTSIAEFLTPIATHDPEEKARRTPRTLPCAACGEVHPQSVQMIKRTTCHGCGHIEERPSKPRILHPIVELYPDAPAAAFGDQISPIESVSNTTGDQISPKGPHPTLIRPTPTLSERFAAGGWE
jgi:primase-polymerase (primpol)-like protein